MELKKICIVSPSLKIGGIERALTVLSEYFYSKGHSVHFISAQGGERFYKLSEGIKIYEPQKKRNKGFYGKVAFYASIISFIRKTVKEINPNVVLSFGDSFNPLVLLALYGTKYPIFISDRTSPDFKFNPFVAYGKKYLYPRSSGFIAQSKRAADYKVKQFGNALKIKIIPNAIKDVKLFDLPKVKQILYVGRLSKEKGPDRLLEAFKYIDKDKGWKLVFAGSGPMKNELQQRAEELKLQDYVIFLGQVKNVDKLLSQGSIFVLPSRLEGFPNALCEAMAAGLPSICFDCIPSGDVITNGVDGFIVPDGDIKELANKINFLIDNPDARSEVAAKAILIRERLSQDMIGDMYLDFILENK